MTSIDWLLAGDTGISSKTILVDERTRMTIFHCDRAISLTQPWATLMAIGAKRNETRSWPTHYRGWIAIHAAKGFPRGCRDLCYRQPFAEALLRAGITSWGALPLGAVLAVVFLSDCVSTRSVCRGQMDDSERAFGDYSDGRYAFLTHSVRRVRAPIPMKGALGIWKLPRSIIDTDLRDG